MGRVALVQPLQYKVLIHEFAEEGWPSGELVYNAEHDLYRFADGEFAFSLGVRQRAAAAGGGVRRVVRVGVCRSLYIEPRPFF